MFELWSKFVLWFSLSENSFPFDCVTIQPSSSCLVVDFIVRWFDSIPVLTFIVVLVPTSLRLNVFSLKLLLASSISRYARCHITIATLRSHRVVGIHLAPSHLLVLVHVWTRLLIDSETTMFALAWPSEFLTIRELSIRGLESCWIIWILLWAVLLLSLYLLSKDVILFWTASSLWPWVYDFLLIRVLTRVRLIVTVTVRTVTVVRLVTSRCHHLLMRLGNWHASTTTCEWFLCGRHSSSWLIVHVLWLVAYW